jgi:hypothetical protein
MEVTVIGMADAQKQMARIERGCRALANHEGWIYSNLPYAHGIETGRHQRSGKLARAAGGSFYMRRAVDTVVSGMDGDITQGMTKVTAPGVWIIRRLARWARRLARVNAPRGPRKKGGRSYRLYRSIKSEVRRK